MKVLWFIILNIVFAVSVQGQIFSKKDFLKTKWFSENKDNSYFKRDTLKLILYKNPAPEWVNDGTAEDEWKHFGHREIVTFNFLSNNKLGFNKVKYHMNLFSPLLWVFNKRKSRIEIFNEDIYLYSLRPIKKEEIQIESKYGDKESVLTTSVMTFIREK